MIAARDACGRLEGGLLATVPSSIFQEGLLNAFAADIAVIETFWLVFADLSISSM